MKRKRTKRVWIFSMVAVLVLLSGILSPVSAQADAVSQPNDYVPFGAVAWEQNAGVTQMKLFVMDENGNPVNGILFSIESAYGGWEATSYPTGSFSYPPGWTDFALTAEPLAGRWNLWVTNGQGDQLSPVVQVETDTDLDGQGHQVATIRWRVNKPGPLESQVSGPFSPFSASGSIYWEPNAGLTQIKLYVKDALGNPVDGVRFRIQTADGSWEAISNPTGQPSYHAGWTDFALRSEPIAATWILWALDDEGNVASDPVSVVTDTNDPQPGGSGHQVATVFWTKNF